MVDQESSSAWAECVWLFKGQIRNMKNLSKISETGKYVKGLGTLRCMLLKKNSLHCFFTWNICWRWMCVVFLLPWENHIHPSELNSSHDLRFWAEVFWLKLYFLGYSCSLCFLCMFFITSRTLINNWMFRPIWFLLTCCSGCQGTGLMPFDAWGVVWTKHSVDFCFD